jgi:transketolase
MDARKLTFPGRRGSVEKSSTHPHFSVLEIKKRANMIRRFAVNMAKNAGSKGAHIGPGLSIVDIVATLYFGVLKYNPENPHWPERDRFILSKGHGVLGLYPALALAGYFGVEELEKFDTDDSHLVGHPCKNIDFGIEASTGSLGHGLSMGVGLALSARIDRSKFSVYVLIGDGECDEGVIWEAAMLANQQNLGNLIVIVDHNKMQADGFSDKIIDLQPLADKWRSFGWMVEEVDGHDCAQLLAVLQKRCLSEGRPLCIVAHTIKGKGVSFFENDKIWHHNRNFTPEQAEMALGELEREAAGLER